MLRVIDSLRNRYSRNTIESFCRLGALKMASVVIRNLDDDVVVSLKEQAKANHRSLEGEIRSILTEQVRRYSRIEEFRSTTVQLRSQTSTIPQSNSVDLIREVRSR